MTLDTAALRALCDAAEAAPSHLAPAMWAGAGTALPAALDRIAELERVCKFFGITVEQWSVAAVDRALSEGKQVLTLAAERDTALRERDALVRGLNAWVPVDGDDQNAEWRPLRAALDANDVAALLSALVEAG